MKFKIGDIIRSKLSINYCAGTLPPGKLFTLKKILSYNDGNDMALVKCHKNNMHFTWHLNEEWFEILDSDVLEPDLYKDDYPRLTVEEMIILENNMKEDMKKRMDINRKTEDYIKSALDFTLPEQEYCLRIIKEYESLERELKVEEVDHLIRIDKILTYILTMKKLEEQRIYPEKRIYIKYKTADGQECFKPAWGDCSPILSSKLHEQISERQMYLYTKDYDEPIGRPLHD